MKRDGVFTITLKLDLNWALVEYHTQDILSNYNLDITAFTREEIAAAWLAAIQHRLEAMAEDSDYFLAANGTEERFFQTLFTEQDTLRGGEGCSFPLLVV